MADQKTVAVHPDTYQALKNWKYDSRTDSFNEAIWAALSAAQNGDTDASGEA